MAEAAESIACDQGCGAIIFDFAGTTCGDCSLAMHRDRIPDDIKAMEWDHAMRYIDTLWDLPGDRSLSLPERVEIMERELRRQRGGA